MIIVSDLESNRLFDWQKNELPNVIHCAVAIDVDTKKVYKFGPEDTPIKEYKDLLEEADVIIGHNFINYDSHVISRVLGYEIPLTKLQDTLIYSKLLWPNKPPMKYQNKSYGGHSLAAYGIEFNRYKPEHEDWYKYTPEMMHRCIEDTHINLLTWKKLKAQFDSFGFSEQSYNVERFCHLLAYRQEKYGMWLDEEYATKVLYEVKDRADALEKEIAAVFPTLLKPEKEYQPKVTKSGELSGLSKNFLTRRGLPENTGPCTVLRAEPFNIDSPKQRTEHLLRLGWVPLEYTEKGSPKITIESLEDENLPSEAKLFGKYLIARNREKIIGNWLGQTDKEGFVHSSFNPIGTWTHRASHSNFFGNPPRVTTIEWEKEKFALETDIVNYPHLLDRDQDVLLKEFHQFGKTHAAIMGEHGGWGAECRDVWRIPHNDSSRFVQVGADAAGIQMRAFAHYIKDQDYVKQILNSDIHVYNQNLAGLKTRGSAKTFIYAFLLGAGNHKVGVIYNMTPEELSEMKDTIMSKSKSNIRGVLDYGLEALNIPKNDHNYALAYRGMITKNQFIEALPGLKEYRKNSKPEWFTALDGRKIKIGSKHLHLACALQSFESCVMKRAKIIAYKELTKQGIWFRYVNDIHDEFQTITEKKHATIVGQTKVNAIRFVGKLYNSLCPLDGDYRIGLSWKDCH